MRASELVRLLSRLTMMAFSRLCLTCCLAATLLTFPRLLIAAEDVPQTPADGSWVRYQLETHQDGKREEFESTITLSIVGTVTEDGQICRWLESKMETHSPPEVAVKGISRVLVPQKDLFESQKPFERARRSWIRRNEAPPKKVDLAKVGNWITWEEQVLWTPGMLKSARALENEPKIIEYQRGRLECTRAFSGEKTYVGPGPGDLKITNDRKYTIWLHPQVPFGFAAARIEGEQVFGEMKIRFTTVFSLQDFGSDAKSELPDCN